MILVIFIGLNLLIYIGHNFIHMSDIIQINLANLIFESSSIKGHFLNIVNARDIIMKFVSFVSINKDYERNSKTKFYLGGCVRTINVIRRNITNLIVIDTFSDQTTAGLKIIDHIIEDIYDRFKILDQTAFEFKV